MVLKELMCRVTITAFAMSNTFSHVRDIKKTEDVIIVIHNRAILPIFTFSEIALCSK